MACRIISYENVMVKYTLLDFIGEATNEDIDCRTVEGKRRYREIFGQSFLDGRITTTKKNTPFEERLFDTFILLSKDIQFLIETMDEKTQRLFTGFLAKVSGSGGEAKMAKVTGLDVKTVRKGRVELEKQVEYPKGRIRSPGGGRPSKLQSDTNYQEAIQALLDDDLAGDPMSEKKWVRKTLRWIQNDFHEQGVKAAISTIWSTFKGLGISLRQNVKTLSTTNHPCRDEQFQYLNRLKNAFLAAGKPVISIDTKKKEHIGNFKNLGRTWRKAAYQTLDHDFPSLGIGKLIPFGIYDLQKNCGHLYCGTSFETSQFVVDALAQWWEESGQKAYPGQCDLLILCDSGGANGYRRRTWKWELQTQLADRLGLSVTVCHYSSGASKWNPIEHQLFSFISLNWAGEPLTSYDKALGFIRSTTTDKGLTVDAHLLSKVYHKGLKVTDKQMSSLNLTPHVICPQWNYTIKPRSFSPSAA